MYDKKLLEIQFGSLWQKFLHCYKLLFVTILSNNLLLFSDPVEFQMTYDRRTGKPIASSIVLLNSGSSSYEVLSEEKYTGSIAQEAKPTKNKNVSILFSN